MKKHSRSLALLLALLFVLGSIAIAQAANIAGSTVTLISNAELYTLNSSTGGRTATGRMLPAGTSFTASAVSGDGEYIALQVQDSTTGAPYTAWILASTVSGATTDTTAGTSTTSSGNGQAAVIYCKKSVNMRQGPGTNYSNLGKVTDGTAITVLASEKDSKGATWYKVTDGTKTFYVLSDYVRATTNSAGTVAPTPTPTPTATPAPNTTSTTGGATGKMTYATVNGKNNNASSADAWGYVKYIPNTNIGSDYGKLYDNNIYCNGLNAKGTDYYYNYYKGKVNYFFAISPQGSEVAVVSGHNMRSSKTGFNNLHKVQDLLLKDASNPTDSVFYINYDGKTTWQVAGFFELNENTMKAASTRQAAQKEILLNFFGSNKGEWLGKVMAYATSTYKGRVISTPSASDKIMILYTCGDYGNGAGRKAGGYQNLYFVLKAIG